MIVTVARTGGVAGLTRSWRVDVDAEPDTESWLVLLASLPWSEAPHEPAARPDRFLWVVTVEARPVREAALGEQQVTGPWRELVDRVRSAGTAERASGRGDRPGRDAG